MVVLMLNKARLIGRLGNNPEMRYLPNGTPCCRVRLATSRRWKDKSGERKEDTQWHRVVAYGRIAEIMSEYLRKGSLISVEGRIDYSSYDKDGVTCYSTDIVLEELLMLDSKSGAPSKSDGSESQQDYDDEMPF